VRLAFLKLSFVKVGYIVTVKNYIGLASYLHLSHITDEELAGLGGHHLCACLLSRAPKHSIPETRDTTFD